MQYEEHKNQVLQTALEIYNSQMVIGTWGNVSIRIAGQPLMVITPSGMDYRTLNAEDMVVVNFQRETVAGRLKPSVESPLHLAVYKNHPGINAVVHVHSPFATAFAVAGQPIPVILEETAEAVGHEVPVAAYARNGTEELANNVIAVMNERTRAVLLARHGLIGLGPDTRSALRVCQVVEKTAQVAILARMAGPLEPLKQEDINFLNRSFKHYGQHK